MTDPRPVSGDAREVAWRYLVATGAGATAGLLVGGVGGRLAMLLLRLTSPETVIGVTSDDGFEIGVVSPDTINLIVGMTFFGGVNGVLYVTLRNAIPARLRLPLWSLLAAVGVGANVIHSDGVDFTLLEPTQLAVVLFLALPFAAAALVVVLVERWVEREPFDDRRLSIGLGVAALCGTIALLLATVVGVAALVVRRVGLSGLIGRVAHVAVPVGLVAAIVYYGIAVADTVDVLI